MYVVSRSKKCYFIYLFVCFDEVTINAVSTRMSDRQCEWASKRASERQQEAVLTFVSIYANTNSIRAINSLQQDINKHKRDEIIAARYIPQPNTAEKKYEERNGTKEKKKLIISINTAVFGDIRIF